MGKYNLKPCPFCGNRKIYLEQSPLWYGSHGYYGNYKYIIKCEQCGCTNNLCQGNDIYTDSQTVKDTITKEWNKRAVMVTLDDCISDTNDY